MKNSHLQPDYFSALLYNDSKGFFDKRIKAKNKSEAKKIGSKLGLVIRLVPISEQEYEQPIFEKQALVNGIASIALFIIMGFMAALM